MGVVRIRSLEPGPAEAEVDIDRVVARGLEIEPVEHVLLVAVIVENLVLRTVQEATRVETVRGDEVSPFGASILKIEPAVAGAKGAIGSRNIAVRLRDTEARAGGHHHHQAGLSSIFGRRRTFNHFHRLDGVDRQLLGEHLAHLVGNRLAVDRKRIRGVIAESVEKPVGIGRNPWRSECHQRTQRRRLAFERQLVK